MYLHHVLTFSHQSPRDKCTFTFSEGSRPNQKFYWERTEEELMFDSGHRDYEDVNLTRNHLRSFSFFRLLTFDHPSAHILQRRMQLSSKIQRNTYGYDGSKHYFAFPRKLHFHGFFTRKRESSSCRSATGNFRDFLRSHWDKICILLNL